MKGQRSSRVWRTRGCLVTWSARHTSRQPLGNALQGRPYDSVCSRPYVQKNVIHAFMYSIEHTLNIHIIWNVTYTRELVFKKKYTRDIIDDYAACILTYDVMNHRQSVDTGDGTKAHRLFCLLPNCTPNYLDMNSYCLFAVFTPCLDLLTRLFLETSVFPTRI